MDFSYLIKIVKKIPIIIHSKTDAITEYENKHGTYESIGQWNIVKTVLPNKSGLYYITNGIDVDVTYFNKERGIFHGTENIDINFWSEKTVELKH